VTIHWLRDFCKLYSSPFRAPTLEEIAAAETEKALVEVQQCDHTILSHQFTRHMALAKIAAMEEWHHLHLARGRQGGKYM